MNGLYTDRPGDTGIYTRQGDRIAIVEDPKMRQKILYLLNYGSHVTLQDLNDMEL